MNAFKPTVVSCVLLALAACTAPKAPDASLDSGVADGGLTDASTPSLDSGEPADASVPDAGESTDAAVPDAGETADAGEAVDAGEGVGVDGGIDAGEGVDGGQGVDAGETDAGQAADAGEPDSGSTVDAGGADAGWEVDAGTPDSGPTEGDAGTADAGSGAIDAGPCGAANEACCAASVCNLSLVCVEGTCVAGPPSDTGKTCTNNSDCASGVCETLDNGTSVCTGGCSSNGQCIPGWTCGVYDGHSVCLCTPTAEICDGKDDNCNGLIDDGPGPTEQCVQDDGADYVCDNGVCTCPTLCSGACVDEQTDTRNCGMCGVICPQGATCTTGACTCPTGEIICNGVCTRSNAENCGTCGNVCPATATCTGGQCVCDNPADSACGAACVDLQTSTADCGTCGNACVTGQYCVTGNCAACRTTADCPVDDYCTAANTCATCASSPTSCMSGCTNDNQCPAGEYCATGPGGDNQCHDGCNEDAQCAATATGREICLDNKCVAGCDGTVPCQRGDTCCTNVCADTATDANNCGGCGMACATGDSCCNAGCSDLQTDNANCGTCGTVCTAGSCTAGNCVQAYGLFGLLDLTGTAVGGSRTVEILKPYGVMQTGTINANNLITQPCSAWHYDANAAAPAMLDPGVVTISGYAGGTLITGMTPPDQIACQLTGSFLLCGYGAIMNGALGGIVSETPYPSGTGALGNGNITFQATGGSAFGSFNISVAPATAPATATVTGLTYSANANTVIPFSCGNNCGIGAYVALVQATSNTAAHVDEPASAGGGILCLGAYGIFGAAAQITLTAADISTMLGADASIQTVSTAVVLLPLNYAETLINTTQTDSMGHPVYGFAGTGTVAVQSLP